MTDQEIFDRVTAHLMTQGRRSLRWFPLGQSQDGLTCSYRGSDGTSCAVGCLITDRLYSPEMEGHSVSSFAEDYPEVILTILGERDEDERVSGIRLLYDLQGVHDDKMGDDLPPDQWRSKLLDELWLVARRHCLVFHPDGTPSHTYQDAPEGVTDDR